MKKPILLLALVLSFASLFTGCTKIVPRSHEESLARFAQITEELNAVLEQENLTSFEPVWDSAQCRAEVVLSDGYHLFCSMAGATEGYKAEEMFSCRLSTPLSSDFESLAFHPSDQTIKLYFTIIEKLNSWYPVQQIKEDMYAICEEYYPQLQGYRSQYHLDDTSDPGIPGMEYTEYFENKEYYRHMYRGLLEVSVASTTQGHLIIVDFSSVLNWEPSGN